MSANYKQAIIECVENHKKDFEKRYPFLLATIGVDAMYASVNYLITYHIHAKDKTKSTVMLTSNMQLQVEKLQDPEALVATLEDLEKETLKRGIELLFNAT